jgi:hypothetical protein
MSQNKIGLFLDDDPRGLERGIILAKMNSNFKALSLYKDSTITWIHVINYDDFVNWISNNDLPYIISFDNDLGEKLEGIDCAKWLSKWCINTKHKVPLFIVHSQNNVVNKRIFDELNDTIKYETTYLQ